MAKEDTPKSDKGKKKEKVDLAGEEAFTGGDKGSGLLDLGK